MFHVLGRPFFCIYTQKLLSIFAQNEALFNMFPFRRKVFVLNKYVTFVTFYCMCFVLFEFEDLKI